MLYILREYIEDLRKIQRFRIRVWYTRVWMDTSKAMLQIQIQKFRIRVWMDTPKAMYQMQNTLHIYLGILLISNNYMQFVSHFSQIYQVNYFKLV